MTLDETVRARLRDAGVPIASLATGTLGRHSGDRVFLVSAGANGKISIVEVPHGVYFRGITCIVDRVIVLLDIKLAADWGILTTGSFQEPA